MKRVLGLAMFSVFILGFCLFILTGCTGTNLGDGKTESDEVNEFDTSSDPSDTHDFEPLAANPEEIGVPGNTYYVDSETGDDSNDGLARDRALATLDVARWKLSPLGGDKLVVKGTFNDTLRLWDINEGMNEDNPTVIQCDFDEDGNPLEALIDGGIREADFPFDKNGLDPGFGAGLGNYLTFGVYVDNVNYITLSGLTIRGIVGRGVWLNKVNHSVVEWMDIAYTSNNAIRIHNDEDSHTENTGEWPKYYGSDMLFEDPLFVSEPQAIGDPGDFQLQEDSPAIGSGTDVGTGTPIDMGAYQYGIEPWFAGIRR